MTQEKPKEGKPKSLEEAVAPRIHQNDSPPQEIVPEQTEDEIVAQAISEAGVETMLQDNVPLVNQAPALNIDPPDVTLTSTLELPPQITQKQKIETPPLGGGINRDFVALRDFILGDSFGKNYVQRILTEICSQAQGLPYIQTWDISKYFDVERTILGCLRGEGFLERIWPSLQRVMGTNIGNVSWTSKVATSIALYDLIGMLSVLEHREK
jgi:hypothetical protein